MLTSDKCDAMMRDPNHLFWSMWARTGWNRRRHGGKLDQTCFGGPSFFDALAKSNEASCHRNWYEGTGVRGIPHYREPAPAVLGFDRTIMQYCLEVLGMWPQPINDVPPSNDIADKCVRANKNVLRLMNGWNICENVKWMSCAANGALPGQDSKKIIFSLAPSTLARVELLGSGRGNGYNVDEVYYLEVCLFNQICTNSDQLFSVKKGEAFECEFDAERVLELGRLLLAD